MDKRTIIDAEFTPIQEGRSKEEIRRKRRRQFWSATIQGLLIEGALIAAAVAVGMLWR